MRTVLKYEHLLWMLLSVSLFMFVIPITNDNLLKLVAGFVFYLFVKEIFYNRASDEEVEHRMAHLSERIGRVVSHGRPFAHHADEDDKKEIDIRSYL